MSAHNRVHTHTFVCGGTTSTTRLSMGQDPDFKSPSPPQGAGVKGLYAQSWYVWTVNAKCIRVYTAESMWRSRVEEAMLALQEWEGRERKMKVALEEVGAGACMAPAHLALLLACHGRHEAVCRGNLHQEPKHRNGPQGPNHRKGFAAQLQLATKSVWVSGCSCQLLPESGGGGGGELCT